MVLRMKLINSVKSSSTCRVAGIQVASNRTFSDTDAKVREFSGLTEASATGDAMAIASPVAEASVKPENSLTFASVSEKVRLLATWIPATRQVLDDFTELMSFILSTMPYYVNLEEELQLLSGDNTGENLHGLIPQAAAFSTG